VERIGYDRGPVVNALSVITNESGFGWLVFHPPHGGGRGLGANGNKAKSAFRLSALAQGTLT